MDMIHNFIETSRKCHTDLLVGDYKLSNITKINVPRMAQYQEYKTCCTLELFIHLFHNRCVIRIFLNTYTVNRCFRLALKSHQLHTI